MDKQKEIPVTLHYDLNKEIYKLLAEMDLKKDDVANIIRDKVEERMPAVVEKKVMKILENNKEWIDRPVKKFLDNISQRSFNAYVNDMVRIILKEEVMLALQNTHEIKIIEKD